MEILRSSRHSRHNMILLDMLRSGRVASRMRQEDLARRLGRGQGTVSKTERGERRLDVIELRDWLNAMDLNFAEFIIELDTRLSKEPAVELPPWGTRA